MSISYFLIIAFRLWANFLVLLLYCRRRVRRAFRPAVRIADVLRQYRRCARWPGSSGSSPWLTITDFNDPVGFFEHEFLDPILRTNVDFSPERGSHESRRSRPLGLPETPFRN
jgi:hypothetical protein